MAYSEDTLTLRFSATDDGTYRLDLGGPDVGERGGEFAPPYGAATWRAVMVALEPNFALEEADAATQVRAGSGRTRWSWGSRRACISGA